MSRERLGLRQFLEEIGSILARDAAERFNGKYTFTINMVEGGIANVDVTRGHQIRPQEQPAPRPPERVTREDSLRR